MWKNLEDYLLMLASIACLVTGILGTIVTFVR